MKSACEKHQDFLRPLRHLYLQGISLENGQEIAYCPNAKVSFKKQLVVMQLWCVTNYDDIICINIGKLVIATVKSSASAQSIKVCDIFSLNFTIRLALPQRTMCLFTTQKGSQRSRRTGWLLNTCTNMQKSMIPSWPQWLAEWLCLIKRRKSIWSAIHCAQDSTRRPKNLHQFK